MGLGGRGASARPPLPLRSRDSVCLSIRAFTLQQEWLQHQVAVGGWCLGGLAGWQAFAIQNGLPVIGPGLQPAAGGLQLQVLVVAGCEEHVLPARVQLGPCKAKREAGSLHSSSRRHKG